MILKNVLNLMTVGKLSVFLYHKVPTEPDPLIPDEILLPTFERMLDEVLSEFKVIPLMDAVLGLQTGTLPARAACITFDDGYADWIHGVIPALLKRDYHATFFITTGQFTGHGMWHERIANLVRLTKYPSLELHPMGLGNMPSARADEKAKIITALEIALKYKSLHERERLMGLLSICTGVVSDESQKMSLDELLYIHSKGFEIGAHTVNHPILTCTNDQVAWTEINEAKNQLSHHIKAPVVAFAYPNGRPDLDFSSSHVNMVKKAGYKCAVTTHSGIGRMGNDVFEIPRYTPWAANTWRRSGQVLGNIMKKPRLTTPY